MEGWVSGRPQHGDTKAAVEESLRQGEATELYRRLSGCAIGDTDQKAEVRRFGSRWILCG